MAQLARLRFPQPVVPASVAPIFTEMAELDIAIAQKLGLLLDTRDLAIAREIIELNAKINKLHASIFKVVAGADWKSRLQQPPTSR